jgi:hypothetical protein
MPRILDDVNKQAMVNCSRCDICGTVWHVPKSDPFGPVEIVAVGTLPARRESTTHGRLSNTSTYRARVAGSCDAAFKQSNAADAVMPRHPSEERGLSAQRPIKAVDVHAELV